MKSLPPLLCLWCRLSLLLLAAGLAPGWAKTGAALTPAQFTREYAEALRKARPGASVAIVGDLELTVTPAGGEAHAAFLHNAYDVYKQEPEAKAEVIARFVAAGGEKISDNVDRTRIVPVIKDRPWLEETRRATAGRVGGKAPEHVYEDFTPELVILYAEDTPKNIRYLTPKDLERVKLERRELRALAIANLRRLLPSIQRTGEDGLHMIQADGTYEASLLLADAIWEGLQGTVKGELVVAIPTRDLLLVCDSASPEKLARLRQIVRDAATGPYRLTPQLFVRRGGKFEAFEK